MIIRCLLLGPRIVLAVGCVAVILVAAPVIAVLGRGSERRYP